MQERQWIYALREGTRPLTEAVIRLAKALEDTNLGIDRSDPDRTTDLNGDPT